MGCYFTEFATELLLHKKASSYSKKVSFLSSFLRFKIKIYAKSEEGNHDFGTCVKILSESTLNPIHVVRTLSKDFISI